MSPFSFTSAPDWFDAQFQDFEFDCFSDRPLDLNRILDGGGLLDTGDFVETALSQSSENHASELEAAVPSASMRRSSPTTKTSVQHGRQARRRRDRKLICTYEQCDFEGSFPRQYELQRHIKAKHSSDKPFTCLFPDCSASFPRSDKLTAHIRAFHDRETETELECPSDGCTVFLDLQMLNLHIRIAHCASFKRRGLLRAVVAAGSTAYVPCPYQSCCSWKRPQDVPKHLMKHAQELDYPYFVNYLFKRHYTVVGPDGLAATNVLELNQLWQARNILQFAVWCPICKQPCNDHASFEAHFDESHVIAQGQQDHFVAWRQYVQTSHILKDNRAVKPWMPWKLVKDWSNVQCPNCDFYREKITINGTNTSLEVDHHLHMLGDSQALEPYRRAVLQLYPDFGTHPVWKDLA